VGHPLPLTWAPLMDLQNPSICSVVWNIYINISIQICKIAGLSFLPDMASYTSTLHTIDVDSNKYVNIWNNLCFTFLFFKTH
uniref:Uncharacterized protein n=1 Tax=Pygocentrus nattereri TaxID=42514 RepID=A0AAR2IUF7_PYGNA